MQRERTVSAHSFTVINYIIAIIEANIKLLAVNYEAERVMEAHGWRVWRS